MASSAAINRPSGDIVVTMLTMALILLLSLLLLAVVMMEQCCVPESFLVRDAFHAVLERAEGLVELRGAHDDGARARGAQKRDLHGLAEQEQRRRRERGGEIVAVRGLRRVLVFVGVCGAVLLHAPLGQPARHAADDARRFERQVAQVERDRDEGVVFGLRAQQRLAQASEESVFQEDGDRFARRDGQREEFGREVQVQFRVCVVADAEVAPGFRVREARSRGDQDLEEVVLQPFLARLVVLATPCAVGQPDALVDQRRDVVALEFCKCPDLQFGYVLGRWRCGRRRLVVKW